jgi:hypothetical protein
MKLKSLGLATLIATVSQSTLLFQQSEVWAEAGTNKLNVGETLNTNEFLVSTNGLFQLYLQGDGNLVAFQVDTNTVYWSSQTGGTNANKLVMQGDNHLVLYRDNTPVWTARNTYGGEPGSFLKIENDGRAVVYKPTSVWSTNGPLPEPTDPPQCFSNREIPIPCSNEEALER